MKPYRFHREAADEYDQAAEYYAQIIPELGRRFFAVTKSLIADVCLSGHTGEKDQTLRRVRSNLSEPEPKLRERVTGI